MFAGGNRVTITIKFSALQKREYCKIVKTSNFKCKYLKKRQISMQKTCINLHVQHKGDANTHLIKIFSCKPLLTDVGMCDI